MSESTTSSFGRVDEQGTVYVRTPDGGERAVGSWQAGPPEQGLAHYARKYDELVADVALLERRMATGVADASAVRSSAVRLRDGLATAAVVGDLAALDERLAALSQRAERRQAAQGEARAQAKAEAVTAKEALAAEAERLAVSHDWKTAGDRLRAIGDDWKALPQGDRSVEGQLWARDEFARRRSEHFAALDEQREEARARKERLVKEAEALGGSTEWGPTAARYKQLMLDWKAAGRAPKDAEEELWQRFRGAQDRFFAARAAVLAERDTAERQALQAKQALLAEAEALDVDADPEAAQRALRELAERWEAAGKVPRADVDRLERRLGAVEDRVRDALDSRWERSTESPFAARLREKVAELEQKIAKARAAGRPTEDLEAALVTQREWLASASEL